MKILPLLICFPLIFAQFLQADEIDLNNLNTVLKELNENSKNSLDIIVENYEVTEDKIDRLEGKAIYKDPTLESHFFFKLGKMIQQVRGAYFTGNIELFYTNHPLKDTGMLGFLSKGPIPKTSWESLHKAYKENREISQILKTNNLEFELTDLHFNEMQAVDRLDFLLKNTNNDLHFLITVIIKSQNAEIAFELKSNSQNLQSIDELIIHALASLSERNPLYLSTIKSYLTAYDSYLKGVLDIFEMSKSCKDLPSEVHPEDPIFNVNENEANEILIFLCMKEIEAWKIPSKYNNGFYNIFIEPKKLIEAKNLLESAGLPRKTDQSL